MKRRKREVRFSNISSNGGFTLLEICVSLFLMALFFLGIAQTMPLSLKLVTEGKLRSEATGFGQGKMEELKSYGYRSSFLTSGSDEVAGRFRRNWTVTPNSPRQGMKEIVVTVSWDLTGKERTLVLTNYVAE